LPEVEQLFQILKTYDAYELVEVSVIMPILVTAILCVYALSRK